MALQCPVCPVCPEDEKQKKKFVSDMLTDVTMLNKPVMKLN